MTGTIRDIVKSLADDPEDEKKAIICTVVSVDEVEKTCDVAPVNDDPEILDIRLSADDSDGLFYVPKIDSVVIVIMNSNFDGFIGMYSALDSIKFGDGSHGGLIKIDDMVSRMNIIESDINDLKTAFTNWIVVPNDGGAALKAIAATWSGSQLTETQNTDIENEDITHGDL